MKTLAIVGFGGHGVVIAETAKLIGWEKIFFYDDDIKLKNIKNSYEFNGNINNLLSDNEHIDNIIIGIGDNKIRKDLYNLISVSLNKFTSIIHPKTIISETVSIAKNCFINANSVINSRTIIEHSTIINTSVTIDHDCHIESGVHLSPGVITGGNVRVGKNTWIGLGAKIINNIQIGKNVLVGAGSVVIKNINENKKVMGVPACEK